MENVQELERESLLREHLVELLHGGFAPTVILLREFHFDKAGMVLSGLHFSAWVLLGHMHARLVTLLQFMKDPDGYPEVWPDAYWPADPVPSDEQAWRDGITAFENDLQEIIRLVQHPATDLFKVRGNGKTLCWASMTALHHNSYHIGQLKTIGRQLGVW